MSLLKIVHAADMQVRVINHGRDKDRHDEYKIGLKKFAAEVAKIRPDILILPGDIFEVWDANGEELKLFSDLLHACLPHCTRIVIVPGNHDLKQRNSLILERSERRMQVDAIQSTVLAINNSKISYYDTTDFHNDPVFPITWAVWSHKYKFSTTKENPLPYSPYENGNKPGDDAHPNTIELFHDPLQGCTDFDGKVSPIFSDYGITLKSFGSNTIIAGDIHSPFIKWFGEKNERLFTYCSSLVQRNYGEGNVYFGSKLAVNGTHQHGYNIIEFDTEQDRATSCEFVKLPNPVSRHTIRLSKDFNYDLIPTIAIADTAYNKIKVVVEGNVQSYIENEEALLSHLASLYECRIEVEYGQNAFEVDVDSSLIDSVESIADKATILKIAEKYIEDIVSKTKTISPELKDEAIKLISMNLKTELDKIELTGTKNELKLISANVSNFMSFATDVSISFGDRSINKIAGTNGVGKTTIFSFILWMITDLISNYQTARNKNYNYALYFNDSSGLDVVSGELEFVKNGDLHKLTKVLTQNRKRNGDVSGYSMELALQSNALTSTDTDEISQYLKDEISTFSDLNRSMFVDQKTLTDLIKTSTGDLNKTILQNIGVDFFDGMLSTYDELRSNQLDRLEKPLKPVDELVEAKALNLTDIETKTEALTAIKLSETRAQEAETLQKNVIEELQLTLHNVGALEAVEQEITTKRLESESNTTHINTATERLTKIKETLALSDEITIQSKINDQQRVVSKVESKIQLSTQAIQTKTTEIASKKTSAQNVALIVKNELSTSVTAVESKISTNDLQILSKGTELLQLRIDYKAKIDGLIAIEDAKRPALAIELKELRSTVDTQKSLSTNASTEAKLLRQAVETRATQIEKLESTTTCPTCSQPISAEKRASIEEKINELKETSKTETDKALAYDEEIVKYKKKLDDTAILIDTNLSASVKIDDDIDALAGKKSDIIDKELAPDFANAVDKVFDEQTVLEELKPTLAKELETAKTNLASNVKSDQRVIDAVQAFKDASLELVKLNEDSTTLTEELSTEKTQLTEISKAGTELDELKHQQTLENDTINKFERANVVIETEMKSLEIKRSFAEADEVTKKKIETEKQTLSTLTIDLEMIVEQHNDAGFEIQTLNTDDKDLDKRIDAARHYKLVDSTLKLYKKLLGTNGLPQYIFAHIIPLFNKHLNELLEDVDFRLEFDSSDLVLYFNDTKKQTRRPVVFISGMEETFSALALIDVMRRLNNAKQIKEIFIDEVSGKLSTGKDLSYEGRNYQALLVRFIMKIATHSNVYIIDHVLNFSQARTIEVYPTANGSKVKITH